MNDRPQRVERWEDGVLDAATIAVLPSGHAIETWGEIPGIAVRNTKTQDRIWIRYPNRHDENWQALVEAVRGGEPFEGRTSALIRHRADLDRRGDVAILAGRSTDGGVLISVRPTTADAPNKGFAVTLDRDDAWRFANAMETAESNVRRDYTENLESFRANRGAGMEVANELTR